jgi:hypothetical protein
MLKFLVYVCNHDSFLKKDEKRHLCVRIEYETQKWLSVHGAVVRDKAVHLHNHYTAYGSEEKGGFHDNKGLIEKFKKQLGQHTVNRIGELA